MALSGNKGEWSEIYALFKLLGDGKLFSGDEKYRKIDDLFFPIQKILRREKDQETDSVFSIDPDAQEVVLDVDGRSVVFAQASFDEKALELFKEIKKGKSKNGKEKLVFPNIESFLTQELNIHALKAKSVEKRDIRMIIHDIKTDRFSELGFSIKSKLGGNSTLFNSNKDGTNFLFQIKGGISDDQIEELNNLSDTKEKRRKGFLNKWFKQIDEWGYSVEYIKMLNNVFFNNLLFIDTRFHKFLADCLLVYYSSKGISKVSEIVKIASKHDPCGIMNDNVASSWYEFSMKQFLIIYALGMTANKPWNCKYSANGGYIVVKEDGDIVCYHFYDRNQLENYLFDNTAFDTPSTERHLFNQIWRGEDGNVYLKLNPQIRFIHEK